MPSAVTVQEIKDATATDETLQNLARVQTYTHSPLMRTMCVKRWRQELVFWAVLEVSSQKRQQHLFIML